MTVGDLRLHGTGTAQRDAPDLVGAPPGAVTRNGGASAAPGGPLGLLHSVDERVDGWFDRFRGSVALDGLAKGITGLGDHGLMWAAATAWRARRTGPERTRAVRALAIAGVGSSLVNAGLKAVIGRSRPDTEGLRVAAGGIPVRAPRTSSFPSGHTLAAFCSATVMSEPADPAGSALLFAAAASVGLSRLHLRAHHASDVLGGAVIGTTLGLLGRRLL